MSLFCICCFCIKSILRMVSSPLTLLFKPLFDCPSYSKTDLPIVLPGILGGANMEAALDGSNVFLEKYCSPLSF